MPKDELVTHLTDVTQTLLAVRFEEVPSWGLALRTSVELSLPTNPFMNKELVGSEKRLPTLQFAAA